MGDGGFGNYPIPRNVSDLTELSNERQIWLADLLESDETVNDDQATTSGDYSELPRVEESHQPESEEGNPISEEAWFMDYEDGYSDNYSSEEAIARRAISNGILDVYLCGEIIHAAQRRPGFSQTSYDELVGSGVCQSVTSVSHMLMSSKLTESPSQQETNRLNEVSMIGQTLAQNIALSKNGSSEQRMAQMQRQFAPERQLSQITRLQLCNVSHCGLQTVGSPPFKAGILLFDIVREWKKPNVVILSQLIKMYRHILLQICSPSIQLRKYTVRLGGTAKKKELIDLPPHLLSILLDFGLQIIGYTQPELHEHLHPIENLKVAPTAYFMKLGNTPEARARKLRLIRDDMVWCRFNYAKTAISKVLDSMRKERSLNSWPEEQLEEDEVEDQ